MPLFQALEVLGNQQPIAPSDAAETIAIAGEFVVPAGLALNDVIEFGALPAFTVPVDLIMACDDIDTGGSATISLDAGLLSGEYGAKVNSRTCGNEFFAADSTARTGGLKRADKAAGLMLACSNVDRGFGLRVAAAAATLAVGAKVRVTLLARPATVGTVFNS